MITIQKGQMKIKKIWQLISTIDHKSQNNPHYMLKILKIEECLLILRKALEIM